MKNKSDKIHQLLFEAERLRKAAFSSQKPKESQKRLAAAEKRNRKALALSREEMAAGLPQGRDDFISSIYGLTALLCGSNRQDEAEPLLLEVRALPRLDEHRCAAALHAYYANLLFDRQAYGEAAPIYAKLLTDTKDIEKIGNPSCSGAFMDVNAMSAAYGNAACAFTYETEQAYSGELFVEPAKRLLELRQQGCEVAGEQIKRASLFAAGYCLHTMCFDTLTSCDARMTLHWVDKCLEECRTSEQLDFYRPAAMRIKAFAAARSLRFLDCAGICEETLALCSQYKDDMGKSRYGSIQDIAADMHLLLGIMHYRVSNGDECITHFQAAIDALLADAQGRPLKSVGYIEVETIAIALTSAEKAAFAYKYMGLAMFGQPAQYDLSRCMDMMQKSVDVLVSADNKEAYFHLLASSTYHIMAQMCERAEDGRQAAAYEEKSKQYGYYALSHLNDCIDDREMYAAYTEKIRARRRLALGHGLLELYGDCLRFEMMLSDEPYTRPNHTTLAKLHFHMMEYCRVDGRYESALEYDKGVMEHCLDDDGEVREELRDTGLAKAATLSMTSCLVQLQRMEEACDTFRQFVDMKQAASQEDDINTMTEIAYLAREIGLPPAECGTYMHLAAQHNGEEGGDRLLSAQLFNQEGMCWYNASSETEEEEDEPLTDADRKARTDLAAACEQRELAAFESAYRILLTCEADAPEVLDLMPSLLSNIAGCYVRQEEALKSVEYYRKSVTAFEALFAAPSFMVQSDSDKEEHIFHYGLCFRHLAELYNKLDREDEVIEALSRAVEVFEKLDSENARFELSYCLHARGCVKQSRGEGSDYRSAVEDITQAIRLVSAEKGSEVPVAVMLQTRADAYGALGDFRAVHADLTTSLNMLDQSGMPEGTLDAMYGAGWFSLGQCQEELNRIGKAADSYRKAAGYMQSVAPDDAENTLMRAVCHYRRAVCLCRRDEQEYYGALSEYNRAIKLLEGLPSSPEITLRLRQLLVSRGSLYERFSQIDLAQEDYRRADSLLHLHH